jgi:hypothetical protein
MKEEEIEMQLWEYIDGAFTEAGRMRIAALIAQDTIWKKAYEELIALNADISTNLEATQPSMRFSKNVMDTITALQIAPATNRYINKGIIRGIAAFFLISIAAMLGYALIAANSQPGDNTYFSFGNLNPNSFFNSSFFNTFIMINIVLGLILLDTLLRRKLMKGSLKNTTGI